MPGVLRDSRLLRGAVWQHTATALREEGRPVALRRRAALAVSMQKTFEEILDFHVRFEQIHLFQDGNGRVGGLIYVQGMFEI